MPANVVPTYLQGRPPTLIKHCLVQKQKVTNSPMTQFIKKIHQLGSFEITKDSGATHTVSFLQNPITKCHLVLVKTGPHGTYPASIFFAVFREIPDWSWESLPTRYLSSAYLTTDNKALADYFLNQGVSEDDLSFFVNNNVQQSKSNASNGDLIDKLDANLDQDIGHNNLCVPDETLACELPKRKKDITVQDSMLRARVTLQNLKLKLLATLFLIRTLA